MKYNLAKPTFSDPRSLNMAMVGIADVQPAGAGSLTGRIDQAVSTYDVTRNDALTLNSVVPRRTDAAHSSVSATGSSLVWKCDVSRLNDSISEPVKAITPVAVAPSRTVISETVLSETVLSESVASQAVLNQSEPNTPCDQLPSSAVGDDAAKEQVAEIERTPEYATAVEDEPQTVRKWRHLLAESAHEVRAPLAVASQIIKAVQSQLSKPSPDIQAVRENLCIAEGRVQQASQWSENILTWRRLANGWPLPIRKRFYPDQWRMTVEPILRGLAEAKNIQLEWTGWDRSLPRLYLDPTHLARVVINLISNAIDASRSGQKICIRVHWQSNVVHRLIIAIEDSGKGMRQELIDFLNGPQWTLPALTAKVTNGLGLQNAKQLCSSLGANVFAQLTASGGTSIRISLPVDQRESLLRSWLDQQIRMGMHANAVNQNSAEQLRPQLQMFAIKFAGDASKIGDFLSDSIQKQATAHDLIYNVSRGRWIWIALGDGQTEQRINESLQRGIDLLYTGNSTANLWLVQLCKAWSWASPALSTTADGTDNKAPANWLSLVNRAARTMEELVGEQVPPTDSLTAINEDLALISRSNAYARANFRVDRTGANLQAPKAQSPRVKPRRVGERTEIQAESKITRLDQSVGVDQRQVLSAIASGWHNQHNLLVRSTKSNPKI